MDLHNYPVELHLSTSILFRESCLALKTWCGDRWHTPQFWLTGTAGLIVPDGFTNFDASDSSDVRLPSFYPGIFTVCKTLVKKRKEQSHSYWLLRKLMVHGVRLLTLLGRVSSDRHVLQIRVYNSLICSGHCLI